MTLMLGAVASAHGGATVLFSEDWTGTTGTAWNATRWPTQRGTNGTNANPTTIQSNQGQCAGANAPGAFTNLSVTDFELLVKMSSASNVASLFPEIGWRISSNVTISTPNGYAIQVTNTAGGRVDLFRINAYTTITTAPATALNAAVTAWFRIRVVGTNHKVRWWIDGNTEPSTWPIDATDATFTSGPIMLREYGSAALLWDDMTVTAP